MEDLARKALGERAELVYVFPRAFHSGTSLEIPAPRLEQSSMLLAAKVAQSSHIQESQQDKFFMRVFRHASCTDRKKRCNGGPCPSCAASALLTSLLLHPESHAFMVDERVLMEDYLYEKLLLQLHLIDNLHIR